MSTYFTADNHPPRKPTNPGTRFVPDYGLDPETDEVVITGETDMQALISACEDSCRLDKILERYDVDQKDFEVIRKNGVLDYTHAPKSIGEAFRMIHGVSECWEGLSPAMRERFPSPQAFAAGIEDGSVGKFYREQASKEAEQKQQEEAK